MGENGVNTLVKMAAQINPNVPNMATNSHPGMYNISYFVSMSQTMASHCHNPA